MTQPVPNPVSIVLCDDVGAGRIVVDLDAFVRYCGRMDASLAELESKWQHLAPPSATRRRVRPPDEPQTP